MINRLKKKFIALAMASLVAMMTLVVAGMNIINYESVVSSADGTLEMLSDNKGRMPLLFGDRLDGMMRDMYDDIDASTRDDNNGPSPGRDMNPGNRGGMSAGGLSRDEAEEMRFFSVLLDSSGSTVLVDTDRIYAVDNDEAKTYAEEVFKSGRSRGFKDEYRYIVSAEENYSRVIFLDCGRTLEAFRKFLYASMFMGLLGLAVLFGVICFFAGRIVRPVAESYEKQKRFITDAGHEIKTPLTIIKANIDVMKMDIDDAAEDGNAEQLAANLQESLDDINGQVDRLTNLTNDLVYLSRMEEAGGTLTMTEVPLSDIVRETAEPFEAVARERSKELRIDVEPMLSVQGSTKELEKLTSIVMENAMKYSPEGDCVELSLKKDGRNAVLEVSNRTENGMSDEDLAHVFDRFYRTDKSRNSAAGGHGIGLSMASAIVSAHGGRIRARSGDGHQFIVTASIPAN